MNIKFKIRDLLDEVRIMKELAAPFLQEGSLDILDNLYAQLETLAGPLKWQVDHNRPIITRDCRGGYERGKKGGQKVHAELCLIWELRPVERRRGRTLQVEVDGKASTVTWLYLNEGRSSKIAHWRMELGDSQSPGSYFHIQIPETLDKGHSDEITSKNGIMWPRWLPVPRIPVLPFTPMLSLEYVLAEIFQDEWPEYLNKRSSDPDVGQWRNIQKNRLKCYFEWQKELVDGGSVSPLVTLKQAKPEPELFLS